MPWVVAVVVMVDVDDVLLVVDNEEIQSLLEFLTNELWIDEINY